MVREPKIALAGNPNVGKSVLFAHLTGKYADVSNYPGTTVDIKTGRWGDYVVYDTPGIYGISSFNDEERVAKDIILDADIVINVVDSTQLARDLFLTLHLVDMGKRVIICLNMTDDANKRGIEVDEKMLSALTGVVAVKISANKGWGLDNLYQVIQTARCGRCTQGILPYLDLKVSEKYRLLAAEDDKDTLTLLGKDCMGFREEIYRIRRMRVSEIVGQAVFLTKQNQKTLGEKISSLTVSRFAGPVIFFAVAALMFAFIGVFVSGYVSPFLEDTVFGTMVVPNVERFFGRIFTANAFVNQALCGKYGIFTMVPSYIFGLLLPLVVAFYLFLGIVEDSGYMARIAYLADRFLTKIGLNGRAVIPFILGFGCVSVAAVSTRVMNTRREKIIATTLLALAIPCSAQTGIIIGALAHLGVGYTSLYIAIIFLVFIVSGRTLNRYLSGEASCFLSPIPPLRIPTVKNVLKKTYLKSKHFVTDALPVFVIGALIITYFEYSGLLVRIEGALNPIVTGLLRLPEQMGHVFVMSVIRRDFGAALLTDLVLTQGQMLTALVTMTLFVPCIASVLVIWREMSVGESVFIWILSVFSAILVGAVVANVLFVWGI